MIEAVMVAIEPVKVNTCPAIWKWGESTEFDQVRLTEKQMTSNMIFKLFRRAGLLFPYNVNKAVCLDKYLIEKDGTYIYEVQIKQNGKPICALVVDLNDKGHYNLLNS